MFILFSFIVHVLDSGVDDDKDCTRIGWISNLGVGISTVSAAA